MKVSMVHAIASLFLITQPLRGADQETDRYAKVQCGKDTVVLFHDRKSPDGRYALGWTIRPASNDAKPVDWSLLDREGVNFSNVYSYNTRGEEMGEEKSEYVLLDGIVDQSNHTFTALPTDYTNDMSVTHGWSATTEWLDSKYAVVIIDARFYTSDVFLLTLGKKDIGVKNLIEGANRTVEKLVDQKRPLTYPMDITYDGSVITEKDELLGLSFSASHSKGSFEDFDGHLIVKLPEANSMLAVTDTTRDAPFTCELGEADTKLNEVYASLRNKLADSSMKKLKLEQSSWITERNQLACGEASEKVPFFQEGSSEDKYREARNNKALELTNARVSALQKQLDSLGRK